MWRGFGAVGGALFASGGLNALELCWLGHVIPAEIALRIGLVNAVESEAEFPAAVARVAAALAAGPPTSVRHAKRTLRAAFERTLEQSLDAEEAAQAACWSSPDVTEGMRAFLEKRAPAFATVAADAPPSGAARRFE